MLSILSLLLNSENFSLPKIFLPSVARWAHTSVHMSATHTTHAVSVYVCQPATHVSVSVYVCQPVFDSVILYVCSDRGMGCQRQAPCSQCAWRLPRSHCRWSLVPAARWWGTPSSRSWTRHQAAPPPQPARGNLHQGQADDERYVTNFFFLITQITNNQWNTNL